jgi:hypothetical protein
VMDVVGRGKINGWRRRNNDGRWQRDGQQWQELSMNGGVSGENGWRRNDTTINQMHGQKVDDQNEMCRRTMVICDDGCGDSVRV